MAVRRYSNWHSRQSRIRQLRSLFLSVLLEELLRVMNVEEQGYIGQVVHRGAPLIPPYNNKDYFTFFLSFFLGLYMEIQLITTMTSLEENNKKNKIKNPSLYTL